MIHFHSFGKWEDVKVADEIAAPTGWPFPIVHQVITQQRRCATCNLVKVRRA